MKPTEQHANTTSTSKTGLFALLRGLLPNKGGGAPKTSQGTGVPARRLLLPVFVTTLAALAFTATPALAALETPENEKVTAVTANTAQVSGVLNPKATAGVEGGFYGFLYGVSEPTVCGAEKLVPEPFPGAGIAAGLPKEIEEETLTGLQPHAKYTVCLLELNTAQSEQVGGAPVPFETKPAPPAIESEAFSAVKAGEVHLEGVVNPNNQLTECHFQYGEKKLSEYSKTELAEKTVACEPPSLPAGFGGQAVSVKVGGLTPKMVYHYQIAAKNGTGEEGLGKEEVFETATPPETPEVRTPESISGTEEVLKGIVNPVEKGNPGTYQFLYDPSATECEYYNENTGAVKIIKKTFPESSLGKAQEAMKTLVVGLLPGTTYTFCLLAHNEAGEESAPSAAETFTTPIEAPTITDESVENVQLTAATVNASVDPGGSETHYYFQYGTGSSYGETTPVTKLEGSLTATDTASATITGLQSGSTYHYRVVVSNVHSPAGIPGPDQTFTTPGEPSTAPETCPNAQARTEQPHGQALPDCRAYEMVSPLAKNGSNVFFQGSRAAVSGGAFTFLSPGSFAEPQGADELSRYLARRGPEGWLTQNISPPRILQYTETTAPFEELLFTPSLSEGIDRSPYVPLVQGEPAGYINLYLADLAATPVSYQTVSNVTPPGLGPYQGGDNFPERPTPAGVSTDLSHVVFQSFADLTEGAGNRGCGASGCSHLYEWAAGKLSQVDISPTGTQFEYSDQVGAPGAGIPYQDTWHAVSADGQRVFFTAGDSSQEPAEGQLYVRENPESRSEDCSIAGDACTIEVSASQRSAVDPNGPQPAYFRDANAEGTRVFFTSRAELTSDANTGNAVSCKEAALPSQRQGDCSANLYEYNLETKELTDLTVNAEPRGAAVLGLVTAGENAGEENSYVYFVANGVLASNENANEEKAQHGNCKEEEREGLTGELTCSLYVAHYNGGAWKTKFIATLATKTIPKLGSGPAPDLGDETNWIDFEGGSLTFDYGPSKHTIRVTPDGTTLAFESQRSLTGYDNNPVKPGGTGEGGNYCTEGGREPNEEYEIKLNSFVLAEAAVPCREVYLYDAVTGRLVCASCDPSGARPVGRAELGGTEDDPASEYGPSPFYVPRNLSENGERLFFQTQDPLVPRDTNGKLNVYEWEAAGEGSCTQAGGCTFPISDVAGDFDSWFMDADGTGENAFIATADQLLPSDTDTRRDVYDVRAGGGFPVSPAPAVCDNGDSCKAPVSPQPGVFAAPASATFSGPGNPPLPVVAPLPPPKKTTTKTVRCKKGRVKNKKGQCVKKPKPKKRAKKASNDRRAH